jgi:hypothetical protein
MMQSLGFLLLLVVTACAPGLKGDPCDGWKPIRPEAADVDVISDSLAEQILQHDEFGASVCGWEH